MPALIILALWTALLGPGVVRWLRQHRPTTSIASFHRQLRGLEHGPKLVEPAYRLEGEVGKPQSHEDRRVGERPQLVLLTTGATQKESTMYEGRYDDEYADAWSNRAPEPRDAWDDPWSDPFADEAFEDPRADPPTRTFRTVRAPKAQDYLDDVPRSTRGVHAHVQPMSRDRAHARRSRILVGLGASILGTFLLGLIPGLTILWALTVIGVVALAGYLGLMYYASNLGLYGRAEPVRRSAVTPVARVVMAATPDARYDDDDLDDGWADERIAAAR